MFLNLGPPELGIACSLTKCLALAKRSGFAGMDLDIDEAQRLEEKNGHGFVKGLFENEAMRIGCWIWFDHFGFSDDELLFQKHLESLPTKAEVAESIGASRVISWILPYSNSLTYQQNFDTHVVRLQAAAKILDDYGQSLALEYIGPRTFRHGHAYEFISDQAGALALLDAVGSRNVGLILDSWHWYASSGTIDDILNLASELAIYVHLSDAPSNVPKDQQIDNVRELPGSTGVVENVAFLKALRSIGYDGPITAEPFSQEISALPDEDAAIRTALALQNLLDQAGIT